MNKSILIVGVGGQGTILTSKITSEGLLRQGYDVKMCEIHGMAQRGGSVTTQIKFGEKIYSTAIGTGEADVLVAFEKVEAARYLNSLKPGGALIVNDLEIYSLPVLNGTAKYPINLNKKFAEKLPQVIIMNANETARELGNEKAQNMVMLGLLVKTLELEEIDWESIIKEYVPQRVHEINIRAFQAGIEYRKEAKLC